ncbi:hypothetical protein JCM1840_003942 [Sporobolomyces johnsonii]
MVPEQLPDPSEMSPQERTLSLVEAVSNDDLLGVLLVLYFMEGDEINVKASSTTRTPLETAVALPTSRPAVRRTIAECLLHRNAVTTTALELAHTHRNTEMATLLENWCKGCREQVEMSRRLVQEMTLEEAEAWISDAGMAMEEPPAMKQPAQDVVMIEQEERKPDLAAFKVKMQPASTEPAPARRPFQPAPAPHPAGTRSSRSPPSSPGSTRRFRSPSFPSSSSSFELHALSLSALPLYVAEADVRELVARIVGPKMVSAVRVVPHRGLGESAALVVVSSEQARDKAVKLLEGCEPRAVIDNVDSWTVAFAPGQARTQRLSSPPRCLELQPPLSIPSNPPPASLLRSSSLTRPPVRCARQPLSSKSMAFPLLLPSAIRTAQLDANVDSPTLAFASAQTRTQRLSSPPHRLGLQTPLSLPSKPPPSSL